MPSLLDLGVIVVLSTFATIMNSCSINTTGPREGGGATLAELHLEFRILEFWNPESGDGNIGWIHVSYNEKGSNRKQVLTFDGKKYTNGLPDMKWHKGEVVE